MNAAYATWARFRNQLRAFVYTYAILDKILKVVIGRRVEKLQKQDFQNQTTSQILRVFPIGQWNIPDS